jgi:exopolyphosphatase/guanosine-5'-triphosphate,3'-diphosphate pyrophosphatase
VAIHKKLANFDPKKIDHTSLTLTQVRALMQSFTGRTLEQLRALPGLPAKRADLIIPGTAVVLATMELLGASRIHVSVRGLRYGVLTAVIGECEKGISASTPGRYPAKIRAAV